ncbi:MAG: hypothetical protein KDE27_30315, partial [Planctomycetes bacterium]|nr:hypothetical protein [Planctomycetota bacterium]
MIASRWRWLLVPVPALALVFAYGLVLRPTYERQVVDLEQRLAAEVGQLRAAATAEPTVDLAARRREVAAAEEAASRRADALLAAWTKPAARAETVQELTRLLGACGAAVLRSNSESAETREGCV